MYKQEPPMANTQSTESAATTPPATVYYLFELIEGDDVLIGEQATYELAEAALFARVAELNGEDANLSISKPRGGYLALWDRENGLIRVPERSLRKL
jgi:hypothetical protein